MPRPETGWRWIQDAKKNPLKAGFRSVSQSARVGFAMYQYSLPRVCLSVSTT